MNPKTKKRVLAVIISLLLAFAAVPEALAVTGTVEYSPSASYASGRYYSALKSVKLTGDQLTDIVNVAKSQIGYHESYSSGELSGESSGEGDFTEYGRWYGYQGPWCNMFASWCAYVAGIPSGIVPKLASAESAYYGSFPSVGAECFPFSSGRALEPGDFVFSCTCSGGYGCIDHVAIVVDVDDYYIYTVDGNFSACVKQLKYPVESGYSSYYGSRINYVARPQYVDNSATPEDVKEASAVKITKTSVFEVYDYAVSLEEAKALSESFGGRLAVLEGNETELSALLSESKYERAFVSSEDGDKVLYSDGTVFSAPEKKRATGFVCEYILDDIKPVNTASFGGDRYEIYDSCVSFEAAKAIASLKGAKLLGSDCEKLSVISLLFKENAGYYTDDASIVALNDGTAGTAEFSSFEGKSVGFVLVYGENEKATLTYELCGGTRTPNEQVAEKGEEVRISSVLPEKENSTFSGWALSPKAKTAEFSGEDTLTLTQDTVLYAVWG